MNPKIRLRYLGVLLASLAGIVVGLYPSILTVGAIVGIFSGIAALIGLLHPPAIESRRRLRRATYGAGLILTFEVIALGLRVAATPRRTVHLALTKNAPGIVRIVYNVSDGDPSAYWRWNRYFLVTPSPLSIIYTQLPADDGWFHAKNPHPVVARTTDGADLPARWISGGYSQAGACHVEFDEFSIGDSATKPRDPTQLLHAGWLDSLPEWGVACNAGQLTRSMTAKMTRTGPACYYDADGAVACGISRVGEPRSP